jgi:hypothetical protein
MSYWSSKRTSLLSILLLDTRCHKDEFHVFFKSYKQYKEHRNTKLSDLYEEVGCSPRLLIRLPSVLMYFLFCIIVKYKTRSLLSQYEAPEKVTNGRASECDISIAFPFPAVTISKPHLKWANQWVCSEVRVTNTCTPVNGLCMYMYTI